MQNSIYHILHANYVERCITNKIFLEAAMGKIIVKVNEEYQVRVLTEPNPDEPIYSSFEQAKTEIEEIVSDTVKYYDMQNKSIGDVLFSSNDSFDFSNNIIAFSGDRGQGKSSAMLSFSNFLLNKHTEKNKNFLGEKICKADFTVLDRIDPTKFEVGDNILTVILAKIFHIFCNEWEVSGKSDIALRSELLELFQICYKEIETIKCHSDDNKLFIGNDLDRLGKIGDSAKLKEHLLKLIEKYFDFHYKVNNKYISKENMFLVIQLDDTDLNTKNAYSIVEDVRKYFMIPNVIVLMAVDLTLLTCSIEQNYMKQFKTYIDYHTGEKSNEYHNMAIKYIDKLIPGRRKIFLPYIKPSTDEYGEQTTIEYIDENKNFANILGFTNNDGKDIKDVQELLIRFIYEKTGLIFIKPNNYRHNIVPGTMRELVNFLSVLNSMDSIKNDYSDAEDLKKRINNISQFETYFTKTWVPNYIERLYSGIIQNLLDSPWTIKNKQVIKDICNLFKTTSSNTEELLLLDVFEKIEYKANAQNDIYTLADVREVLSELESRMPHQEIYKLTFAVRTIYSIYISRLICNGLLHEINGEDYDYGAVCDFLGGDIFGEAANKFIRKQNNRYDRAVFRVNAKDQDNNLETLNDLMEDKNNAYIAAAFCNFEFPNEQEFTPPYDVSYKRISNNTKSTIWNFNISYPFFYLIQPIKLNERINGEFDSDYTIFYPYELLSVRYACIQIISSMDLINYLEKNLSKSFLTRSRQWEYYRYVVDFFDRVDDTVSKIKYLPIENDWEEFKMLLLDKYNILENLYDVYIDNYGYVSEQEFMRMEILGLSTYKNTKDYDTLVRKIDDLHSKLDDLIKRYDDDEYNKILECCKDELDKIYDNISMSKDKMTIEEIRSYQWKLNALIRELKNLVSE